VPGVCSFDYFLDYYDPYRVRGITNSIPWVARPTATHFDPFRVIDAGTQAKAGVI